MLFYALYDKKAMCYFPPFTVENKIQAIRGVEREVNISDSVLNRYPEDFALYYLGEFDNKSGRIKQPDIMTFECECMQLLRPVQNVRNFISSHDESEEPSGSEAASNERSK